jgi:uncharacterized protein
MLGCTGLYDHEAEAASQHTSLPTPGAFPDDGIKKPTFPPGPRNIYLHGHAASRLFTGKEIRLPVTVAASSMQGIVLALAPFHNSCNYTSVIIHGYASIITDEAERLFALTLITDNLVPGRWDNSRNPPTKAELTSTGVLKVEIESASAKIRTGEPSDDRPDVRNEELVSRVWTGVLPCWRQYGKPVASTYNRAKVPGYLSEFVVEEGERGEREAGEAISKGMKK